MTDYRDYKWIKVKQWKHDSAKSVEENYKGLQQHHIEETMFLIEEVRKLAKVIENVNFVLKGLENG